MPGSQLRHMYKGPDEYACKSQFAISVSVIPYLPYLFDVLVSALLVFSIPFGSYNFSIPFSQFSLSSRKMDLMKISDLDPVHIMPGSGSLHLLPSAGRRSLCDDY